MPQTRWLDADEQQTWRGLVSMMTLLDVALDRGLQASVGIRHAQYGILAQLSMAPRRTLQMSELAAMTSSSLSRLSHAMSTLEKAGWVTRSPAGTHSRAVNATLTDAGLELVRRAAPGHVEAVRRFLFDNLDPEQVLAIGQAAESALAALAEAGYVNRLS